ncbi:Zn-ribbon domain-containing OB-fold protein [Bradyrhizobium sp. Arg314]
MTQNRPPPRIGRYDRPFWAYAEEGELRVQVCSHCARHRYPPGPNCPECLSGDAEWVKLSGKGKVIAWTVFHRSYFPAIPVPYTVVSVETDEGPLLIGNLVDAEGTRPAVGLDVKAVFQDVNFEERRARICQWTPA